MFTFKPAIYRQGTLHELPRPLLSLRIQDEWDFARFKVPLLDGDAAVGHSRGGMDLSLEGQIGVRDGALCTTEEAMFLELEALRGAFDVKHADDAYQFFLYHDDASGVYRSFKECTTVRFEYDLSNKRLFSYSAVIHAADPTIHTTAPA